MLNDLCSEFQTIKAARERADQEFQMLMKKISDVPDNVTIHAISFDDPEVIDALGRFYFYFARIFNIIMFFLLPDLQSQAWLDNKLADDSVSLDTPPETPEKLMSNESDFSHPPLENKGGHENKVSFVNSNNNKNSFMLKGFNKAVPPQIHSSTKIQSFHFRSSNDSDVLFDMEGMGIEEFSPMSNDTLSDEGELDDDGMCLI
jgi:hypothetical protein